MFQPLNEDIGPAAAVRSVEFIYHFSVRTRSAARTGMHAAWPAIVVIVGIVKFKLFPDGITIASRCIRLNLQTRREICVNYKV